MAPLSDQQTGDRPITVLRSKALHGRFRVGPDPMLFSLAALLGVLARGVTVLYHDAGKIDANLHSILHLLEAVGAQPEISDDRWEINGLGSLGLLQPTRPLDFSGARQAAPLALALLGCCGTPSRLIGDMPRGTSLAPAIDALRGVGIEIGEQRTGHLPLTVKAPLLTAPFDVRLPQPAIEIKAALLLAALSLPGVSKLTEAQPGAEHPEHLVRHFGASIAEVAGAAGQRSLAIGGLPALGARTLTVAGDPNLAIFPLLAALIVPDSDVLIENVPIHPARITVLTALEEMGGDIEITDRRPAGGEEVADIRVRHSPLLGVPLGPGGLSMATIAPLAVAGAFAAGETQLRRAGFAGEATLHRTLASALAANGATVRLGQDGLTIARPAAGARFGGGTVASGDDPFLAAALLVFGLATAEQVTIENEGPMIAAFPELIGGLEALGAEFYREEAA